jgi:hypothetical protein
MSSPRYFSGVRVARFLFFGVTFFRRPLFGFVLFFLATVLSVLLRFTAYDYPFGISETEISNLVRTTRFCENLHPVHELTATEDEKAK